MSRPEGGGGGGGRKTEQRRLVWLLFNQRLSVICGELFYLTEESQWFQHLIIGPFRDRPAWQSILTRYIIISVATYSATIHKTDQKSHSETQAKPELTVQRQICRIRDQGKYYPRKCTPKGNPEHEILSACHVAATPELQTWAEDLLQLVQQIIRQHKKCWKIWSARKNAGCPQLSVMHRWDGCNYSVQTFLPLHKW